MANSGPVSNRGTAQMPSAAEFKDTWGVQQEYLAVLRVNGLPETESTPGGRFEVSTSLDENFSLSLGSNWSAPYANVLSEGMDKMQSGGGNGALAMAGARKLGQAAGLAARSRYTSAQVWESTDPLGLTIPFTFIATTNAGKDVRDKVKTLLKMAAPTQVKGILQAPGPSILGQAGSMVNLGGVQIDLFIGNFLALYNCIIGRVDAQFDNMMGIEGIPMKAKVNVDIRSFYTCFTTQDIDAMFDRRENK